jgi:chromosome segregation ATPase
MDSEDDLAKQRRVLVDYVAGRKDRANEWEEMADRCLTIAVNALDLADEIRSVRPDPVQIAHLEQRAAEMEAKEADLRERAQAIRAELPELAQRVTYMLRLSDLLNELLRIAGRSGEDVDRLRAAVSHLRRELGNGPKP